MTTIKAPFNFVPLSQKVYIPEWGDLISQDIPFEDGLSGTIDFELQAETPIFIRNASDNRNQKDKHFCKSPDGRFMIPGTTLKGEIRNILSILSCGKIRVGKNVRFAQREWYNDELYPMKSKQTELECGWLTLEGNSYVIKSCGTPYRIAMDSIDSYTQKDIFKRNFSQQSRQNLNQVKTIGNVDYDPKTAAYKYKLFENINLDGLRFAILNKNKVKIDMENGTMGGTIIFTGQPSLYRYPRPQNRDKRAGKFYEFVFEDKTVEVIPIDDDMYRQYALIYSECADWKYWKAKGQGIPVFFRKQKDRIKDFGLAFLYKLPYEKTVEECAVQEFENSDKDLSECIFGYIGNEQSMKGRVQFSAAYSDNARESQEIRLVLNNPKASYYPIYIKQEISANGTVGRYNTYNEGEIAGYKRYVQRERVITPDTSGISDSLTSLLIPLAPGALFKGKIRFHNLREMELGALLSAMTFHNTPGCYHQFGQAKPYGYGRTSIKNIRLHIARGKQADNEYYMALFEKMLSDANDGLWINSVSVNELISISSYIIPQEANSHFGYMFHQNNNSDFVNAKRDKEALKRFSEITTYRRKIKSLYNQYKTEVDKKFELEIQKQNILKEAEKAAKARAKKEAEEKARKEAEEKAKKEAEEKARKEAEEKAKKEAEEKARKEAEEKAKKEAEEKARKEAEEKQQRINEKIASGLSFLNETLSNSENAFKVNDFNGGFKRIEQWKKKTSCIITGKDSEEQLIHWLSRSFASEKRQKEKEAWRNRSNKNIWLRLELLLDKDQVDRLFAIVTSNESKNI